MYRRNRPHIRQQHNNHVHRWTVSYADYMTLMFALFVVLYAVLLNKKDNYQQVIEAIQHASEFVQSSDTPTLAKINNKLNTDTVPVLLTGQDDSQNELSIVSEKIDRINLFSGQDLSNATSEYVSEPLILLQLSLQSALEKELKQGTFSVDLDGDWLTIEMRGPLLFAAGSHTLLNDAKKSIQKIGVILKSVHNMIRLRGYTDTNMISDEIYKSNWELSAMRALSVLHAFNKEGIAGERMVVESFGKYQPVLNDSGTVDQFKSRRVVIAISKFLLFTDKKSDKNVKVKVVEEKSQALKPDSDDMHEIHLPDGRLIITTRQE